MTNELDILQDKTNQMLDFKARIESLITGTVVFTKADGTERTLRFDNAEKQKAIDALIQKKSESEEKETKLVKEGAWKSIMLWEVSEKGNGWKNINLERVISVDI